MTALSQRFFNEFSDIACLFPRNLKGMLSYKMKTSSKPCRFKYMRILSMSDNIHVKCSKCELCVTSYRDTWSTRMYLHASSYGNDCCFLTLTFSDDHHPDDTQPTIYQFQKFMKRLRKILSFQGRKVSYVAVSERGDINKTHRLHYHLILYGVSYLEKALIEKCWKKGFICVKPVDHGTCRYVLKYVLKGAKRDREAALLKVLGKNPNFFSMSRRPGIGFAHVKQFASRYLVNPFVKGISRYVPSILMKRIMSKEDFSKYYKEVFDKRVKEHVKRCESKNMTFEEYCEYYWSSLKQKALEISERCNYGKQK